MKRADVLRAIAYAGYHGDASEFTRLYIEHRVSIAAVREAFRQGASAKANGVLRRCAACTEGSER